MVDGSDPQTSETGLIKELLPPVEGPATEAVMPAGQTHILLMAGLPAQPPVPFLRLWQERGVRVLAIQSQRWELVSWMKPAWGLRQVMAASEGGDCDIRGLLDVAG